MDEVDAMFARRDFAVSVVRICWVIWASAIPAQADSISVAPIVEGEWFSLSPSVGSPSPYLSMGSNPGGIELAAVKFDITSISMIPQGAVIESATLNLFVASGSSITGTFTESVSAYGDNSGTMGISDFQKPLTFIGNSPTFPNTSTITSIPITFDVTRFLQSLVNSRTDYIGSILSNGSHGEIDDYSTVTPYPAYSPNLSITFASVPEPQSALLAGLGLAGIAAATWLRTRC